MNVENLKRESFFLEIFSSCIYIEVSVIPITWHCAKQLQHVYDLRTYVADVIFHDPRSGKTIHLKFSFGLLPRVSH